jgi:hypothetical protein
MPGLEICKLIIPSQQKDYKSRKARDFEFSLRNEKIPFLRC